MNQYRANPRTYFLGAVFAGMLLIMLILSKKDVRTVDQTAVLKQLQNQIDKQNEVIQEWNPKKC